MNCNSAYAKLHHMQSVKRWVALTIFIFLIVGYLLSATFILKYIYHEHDTNGIEGSCEICAHFTMAENIMKHLCATAASALFALVYFFVIRAVLKPADFHSDFYTPVRMKVRINS